MVCVCVAVECGWMIWVFVWGVGACCDDGGDGGAEGKGGDMV